MDTEGVRATVSVLARIRDHASGRAATSGSSRDLRFKKPRSPVDAPGRRRPGVRTRDKVRAHKTGFAACAGEVSDSRVGDAARRLGG